MKLMSSKKIALGFLIGSACFFLSCKKENIEPIIDTDPTLDTRIYVSAVNWEGESALIIRYHINSLKEVYKTDTILKFDESKISFGIPDRDEKYLYFNKENTKQLFRVPVSGGPFHFVASGVKYGYPHISNNNTFYFTKFGGDKLFCFDTKTDLPKVVETLFSPSEAFVEQKDLNNIYFSFGSKIMKGLYDNPDEKEAIYSEGQNIGKVLVDTNGETVYWMDHLKAKIFKKNTDGAPGSEEGLVSTKGDDFNIDFEKNLLFYSRFSNESLYMSNLDGSNEKLIVNLADDWDVADIQVISPPQ